MSHLFVASMFVVAAAVLFCGSEALPTSPKTLHKTGLTKTEAEDLMDWLEAHGYRQLQLSYTSGQGFAVDCV